MSKRENTPLELSYSHSIPGKGRLVNVNRVKGLENSIFTSTYPQFYAHLPPFKV